MHKVSLLHGITWSALPSLQGADATSAPRSSLDKPHHVPHLETRGDNALRRHKVPDNPKRPTVRFCWWKNHRSWLRQAGGTV